MKGIFKHIIIVALQILATINSFAQPQFTVEKLPFNNNEYDEFAPAFYKDGIIFCSNRKNNIYISYSDTSDQALNLFDLYFNSPKDDKKWNTPTLLGNNINSIFQEGPACVYSDSTKVIFTRNISSQQKRGNYTKAGNYLGLYFADISGTDWVNIKPFEFNNNEYNIMHPAITNDGTTLYFSSDKPGGIGGYDLYVSYYKWGRWSEPKNLGPKVNSPKNDAFPFIHPSGRLFFSSKGWNSKGGFDIFFTQQFNNDWIVPQSLKEPINSNADDIGFIADEYMQIGYFSSNKGKSDDLYVFRSIINEFENCKAQQKNNFCYIFYENGTSEGDVTGSMKYEWDLGDGTKIRAIQAEHCYAKTGKYLIQLNVIDSLTGDIYITQAQYEFDVQEIEQPFITSVDVVKEGEIMKFDAKKSNLKNFKVAKYYWDFGDGLKAIGDETSHIFYQEGVYDVKLQLESVPGRNGVKKSCVFKSIVVNKSDTFVRPAAPADSVPAVAPEQTPQNQ